MVGMGGHDELESRYTLKFEALLGERGVIVGYRQDRAGIDTGLHLFGRVEKTTTGGDKRAYWRPLPSRVWFQLKGLHATTMSTVEFAEADHINIKVGVDHLRFWFAAPEPVYLVVYVESVDTFIGIDVRELVDNRWGATFYASMRDRGGEVTVHVPTAAVMDAERIAALVNHRSMRIDGPAFRGRPLGHRLDPLRSVLAPPDPGTWTDLVTEILLAHDFRETSRHQEGDRTILHGTLAQTLLWQSPAFVEYGYSDDPDEVRDEPAPEQAFGDVRVILDSGANSSLPGSGLPASARFVDEMARDVDELVFFRDVDLSSTGGAWRSAVRSQAREDQSGDRNHLGLEALSYLVLTTTLVYLEFAPDLDWDRANYIG
jgi:hypothetical protein